MTGKIYLFLICNLLAATSVFAYLNVLVIPGIFSPPGRLQVACDAIVEAHPGTNCTLVQAQNSTTSPVAMNVLVQIYLDLVLPHFKANPNGIHLVCHSQGTLICRAIIERTSNHPVKTFAALAGPQMGQFGIPDDDNDTLRVNELITSNQDNLTLASPFIYSLNGQASCSVAGYWKDPKSYNLYLFGSSFLSPLNNEISHFNSTMYKQNFLLLTKFLLIGSPSDGVIKPWQSTQMEFYDEHLTVIPLEKQLVYINDTFGIRTLDERNGLFRYVLPDSAHSDVYNSSNLNTYVVPHLS